MSAIINTYMLDWRRFKRGEYERELKIEVLEAILECLETGLVYAENIGGDIEDVRLSLTDAGIAALAEYRE